MSSHRLLLVLGLVGVAASCGSRDSASPPRVAENEPLAECEAYVDAYRVCFGGLSAEARRLTDARVDGLRAGFDAGARSGATREATRRQCEDGARQLRGACR